MMPAIEVLPLTLEAGPHRGETRWVVVVGAEDVVVFPTRTEAQAFAASLAYSVNVRTKGPHCTMTLGPHWPMAWDE